MAKAKRAEPTSPPVEIILSLTESEASVLLLVLDEIGGEPWGPRGRIDSISAALDVVGVRRACVLIDGGIMLGNRNG